MDKKRYDLFNDEHRLLALRALKENARKNGRNSGGTGKQYPRGNYKLPGISNKSAKIIAQAIRSMLQQP